MSHITDEAGFKVVRRCGPYEPLYYAGASGDFNPIHIDDAFAIAAGLPGKILQGLCTLSWVVEAVVAHVGDPAQVAGVKARFHRPVVCGDDVTIEGRHAVSEHGARSIACHVTNQRGEEVLRSATVELRDGRVDESPPVHAGPTYGPFRYVVGEEKVREFAQAIHGSAPSLIYPTSRAGLPSTYDMSERHRVAPPTFAVNFAIQPFLDATMDPALGIDFSRVVHGEQAFSFLKPVRPGDVLSTTGTLVRDFEKSGNRLIVVETVTVDAKGEAVVRASWTAVVRR